ncbi:MAG TPA: hypothetical protein DIW80_21860 [Gordonia polyisoprenivorans]|nr:hypothetical protein [Gordonia polyisoprenivorans]
MRAEIRTRLERNALDRARHEFADRIIEYAVANATVELPEVLIDQEVEVMHDEFKGTLARQGISEEAYLKAVDIRLTDDVLDRIDEIVEPGTQFHDRDTGRDTPSLQPAALRR